jgi:hypothetical protein
MAAKRRKERKRDVHEAMPTDFRVLCALLWQYRIALYAPTQARSQKETATRRIPVSVLSSSCLSPAFVLPSSCLHPGSFLARKPLENTPISSTSQSRKNFLAKATAGTRIRMIGDAHNA